jgi:hypothetical protein
MADKQAQSAVNFQSETGNIDFQSETGQAGLTERIGEAAQNVNWNKVGVGVGAAAVVAGAAYAATRIAGRGSAEAGESEGRKTGSGDRRD